MNNIDWSKLAFGYLKTDFNIRCSFRDGKWGELEVSDSEHIDMHIGATCLHYGQEAFEGLKAFRGKDGKIRVFRLEDNAKRLQDTANGILMQPVPSDIFRAAVLLAVSKNTRWVPPYGSGASLYIRPLLIGMGPKIGVSPADEYLFLILVTPVGPYFKAGFKPSKLMITRDYDRAAPQGTGHLKVGGNYAAALKAGELAHAKGYSAELYLDSIEHRFIDECGPGNFFGIRNNIYITPQSNSILPSITNKSIMQLVTDMGMKFEQRPVELSELETFDEAGACGTAAVISPICQIDDLQREKSYKIGDPLKAGPISEKLYNKLRAIQLGEEPDTHGWITIVEES